MKKALVAVLALVLTAGGFAAAGDKGMLIGVGYGNNNVEFTALNSVSCNANALEIEFGSYQQLGNGPLYFIGDLGFALPKSIDLISGGTTLSFSDIGFSYAMNALFGLQYTLSFGSPLSFGIGAGAAFNASSLDGGSISLMALGAGGKASIKFAFSKNLGLVLGVKEMYYFLPILASLNSYDYTDYFTSANNLSGSLCLAISY